MSHYPIILIPPQIQRVKSELPPKPVFSELLPQQPGEEPKKVNTTVIAVEATAVTIPSIAITSQGGTAPGLLLFLAGAGAIAAQAWRQITTYPKRKQKHRREVAVYREKLEEYNQKQRQHEEEVRVSQSPERVAEFQYKLLLDILRRTVPHDGNGSNPPEGRYERMFREYLRRYFSNKIQTKLKVQNPNYSEGYHYTPDFAYIDEQLNLHIDIEIDEPYVYRSGQPTHFLYAWKDERRNEFFNDRGWIVIRFSEEQIARYPHSCCKTIAQVIAQTINNESILDRFTNIPDLQPQRQWTETEAIEMA